MSLREETRLRPCSTVRKRYENGRDDNRVKQRHHTHTLNSSICNNRLNLLRLPWGLGRIHADTRLSRLRYRSHTNHLLRSWLTSLNGVILSWRMRETPLVLINRQHRSMLGVTRPSRVHRRLILEGMFPLQTVMHHHTYRRASQARLTLWSDVVICPICILPCNRISINRTGKALSRRRRHSCSNITMHHYVESPRARMSRNPSTTRA